MIQTPAKQSPVSKSPGINVNTRRYDLDWLRVLAFGLLIFYHIGMLYVADWGYHYKSQYRSEWLQNLMLLVNPWRMSILWIISGVATSFMLAKMNWARFLATRSARLLIPLAFGVWVIVPPQLFVEMSSDGNFSGSYLEFYRLFLSPDDGTFSNYPSGIWHHVDVNHLWYLRELWLFTLLLMVCLPVLSWLRTKGVFARIVLPLGAASILLAFPLLMTALDLVTIPDLGNEGRRIGIGLVYFFLGYAVATEARIWQAFARMRYWALGLCLCTYAAFLIGYHVFWLDPQFEMTVGFGLTFTLLDHANRWFWLCAIFGFAQRYLSQSHPWLGYLSQGVFTFYIVHQTLVILLAYWLTPWHLGPILEPLIVTLGTFSGCLLCYDICRRIRVLRPLMGMRWDSRRDSLTAPKDAAWAFPARAIIAGLIVLPIGLEILL